MSKADPNCKTCGGYGTVSVGSICTGFGGQPEIIECMCVLYLKLEKIKEKNKK